MLTNVAVVEPDPMSVVLAVALHGVVGEVALSHFIVWIDYNLNRGEVLNKLFLLCWFYDQTSCMTQTKYTKHTKMQNICRIEYKRS